MKKLILLVACFFYTADNESIHDANSQEETSKHTFTKIQQKNYTDEEISDKVSNISTFFMLTIT